MAHRDLQARAGQQEVQEQQVPAVLVDQLVLEQRVLRDHQVHKEPLALRELQAQVGLQGLERQEQLEQRVLAAQLVLEQRVHPGLQARVVPRVRGVQVHRVRQDQLVQEQLVRLGPQGQVVLQ